MNSYINASNKIRRLIDWLTITFTFYNKNESSLTKRYGKTFDDVKKDSDIMNELLKILHYDKTEITSTNYPIGPYKDGMWTLGENIKILFGGPETSTSSYSNKLEISGAGCRDFEGRGGSYKELFLFFKKHNGHFTRVDNAFDVFTNQYFTIDKLIYYIQNNSYSSPLCTGRIYTSFDRKGRTGISLYLGSEKARTTLICIYDKKLEIESKGKISDFEYWYRVEIRYYQDRAEWFINNFLTEKDLNNDDYMSKALFKNLDFKDINYKNKEVSQRPTATFWKEFLGVSEKAEFGSIDEYITTIEKRKEYIANNAGRSLAVLYLQDPFFLNSILKICMDKIGEIDPKDIEAINKYNRANGIAQIDSFDIEKKKYELEDIFNYINK